MRLAKKKLLMCIGGAYQGLGDLASQIFRPEASGLLNQMQRREFIVCLVVLDKVLPQVQVVRALMQKKNMTLAPASRAVASTVAALEKKMQH
jgi:hypothetical protein